MVTNPAVCPATLKPGCTGYAPRAVKEVFGGRTMPVQFPYELPPDPGTYHLKIEKRKYQFTDLPSELTLDVFEEEDPVFPSLYSWLVNNKSILPLASKLVIDKAEGVVNFNENYEGLGTHSTQTESYSFVKNIDFKLLLNT